MATVWWVAGYVCMSLPQPTTVPVLVPVLEVLMARLARVVQALAGSTTVGPEVLVQAGPMTELPEASLVVLAPTLLSADSRA